MHAESRLEQMLLLWEELREQGAAPTVEQMCRDCPELADEFRRQVAALAAFDPVVGGGPASTVLIEQARVAAPRPAAPPGYEIVRELGRGGMGVVYEARQRALDRRVALKMLRSGALAGKGETVRFHTEAEAVARLQHPNIVQIHEFGDCDGQPYFALEYVPGGSLDRRLAGGPLPPADAAGLVEALARAMHYAHERGVVHRDLKPANVLLAGNREQGTEEAMPCSLFPVPCSLRSPTSVSPSASTRGRG